MLGFKLHRTRHFIYYLSNYLDLLLEMPRYCYPLEINRNIEMSCMRTNLKYLISEQLIVLYQNPD